MNNEKLREKLNKALDKNTKNHFADILTEGALYHLINNHIKQTVSNDFIFCINAYIHPISGFTHFYMITDNPSTECHVSIETDRGYNKNWVARAFFNFILDNVSCMLEELK